MRRTITVLAAALFAGAAALAAPAAAQAAPVAATARPAAIDRAAAIDRVTVADRAAPAAGVTQAAAAGCFAYASAWNAIGNCSGIDPLQTWYVMTNCQYWSNNVPFNRLIVSGMAQGDGVVTLPCSVNETVVGPTVRFGQVLPPEPAGPVGQITGYASKCVDVKAASSADRTPVQIWDCNGTNAQQWKIATDGTVRALGKCLDVAGAGTANGTKAQLYSCNGTGAQQWQVRADGSILNPQSGRCLDDLGFSTANGNQLGIWDCNGAANQVWHVPA
ncbi:ricin-type beta-trefoil lectin domain protein [Kitasatospora sp. NPDC058218]|uniref:ricin-type beta-trefoil lectin domain protein n=1 Tax=Kitasatospora sp. NPDC058218 TaxID=3346385 RepID=UPI0036D85B29